LCHFCRKDVIVIVGKKVRLFKLILFKWPEIQDIKLSIFIEKNGKKVLPRSFYIKILVFTGLICVSVVLMQPIQAAISRGMLHIRTDFLEKIENQIGMEIRYLSIRPSFFGSFDIRNLKLIKDDTALLSVNRARLYFSVSELVFNKKLIVHIVQIDHPELRVDYEKDRDTLELLTSLLKNNEGNGDFFQQIAEFLPEDADYRIRNLSLIFSGEGNELGVHDMDVDIRWDGEKITIGGKFGTDALYSGFMDRTFIAKTTVDISGAYSPDLKEGAADLSFLSFSLSEQDVKKREASFLRPASNSGDTAGTLFTLLPSSMAVSFNENSLSIAPPPDASLSYDFNCDLKTGGIEARVDFNRFVLNDHADFSDYLKKFRHLFDMSITGSSSLKYEKGASLEYAVNLMGGEFFRVARSETAVISDSFVISAYGGDENIVVNDFRLSASSATASAGLFHGILGFQGRFGFDPFLPSGNISVSRLNINGKEDVDTSLNISSNTREINISGESVNVGKVSFLNPDVYLYPQEKYVGITASVDSENRGTVYLDAVFNKTPLQLEATLSLASFSIMNITEAARPFGDFLDIPSSSFDYIQDISLDTEIFFMTDFKNIVFNAPYTFIKMSDNEGFLSLSGTDRQVTLSEGLFSINENEFILSAQFNYSNPADLNFLFDANYLDLSWHIEGQILDRTTLIIRDPNGLNVYGFISNTGSRSGYIECIDFPVPFNGHPSYLNLYSTLRYDSRDFWNLDVAHFEIQDIRPLNNVDYLRISGVADQVGASFREILYSDAVGLLAGSADFSWDSDFSHLQFFVNMTDGKENGELYLVEGAVKNKHVEIDVSVTEMHLERFLGTREPVLISAGAFLSWDSIHSFDAKINLSSLHARVRQRIIAASGAASLTNDEILLSNIRFDYMGIKSAIPLLQINREDGIAKTNLNVQGYIQKIDKWLEGTVDLNADFARVDSWLDIRHALNSIDGTLRFANIEYGDIRQDEVLFVFSNDRGNFSFSGGEKDMLRVEMDGDGNFFAGLSAPVPIVGTFAGVFKNGAIDAHCGSFFIDMPALYKLAAKTDNVNFNGGYITGKIDIRGPVFNPEFFAEARGSSFRIQVSSFSHEEIKPAPFNIVAQGYEFTFGPVMAISGNGAGNVIGWMRFENWGPKNIGLDIDVPAQNPIPYNINISSFRANGNASGKVDMLFDLNNYLMEISGNLYTNNTEMGLNMNEIMARSDDGSSSDVRFHSIVNLSVTAGPVVEFVWPNTNSPILRANPEMGTVFRVTADTQAGQYSMNGDINIRSGELYYFERSFFIREGSMIFRENERQFSPLLSARAEIKDRTDTGPVTITMIIENQPFFSFIPRFETMPSLTQLEIYTILGQNLNSVQGDDNSDAAQRFILASTTDILTQVAANSDVFSQFVFLRQFERQARNFLHLDMFNVRTRLIQNAVVIGATGLGQAPVDRNNSLGNYFDNTTVFMGKYIGQDVFGQFMVTMKYDENDTTFGGIKFELDLGIELQSPYFNIRWDFNPYHPENWWVNDNSITLSWSKSF